MTEALSADAQARWEAAAVRASVQEDLDLSTGQRDALLATTAVACTAAAALALIGVLTPGATDDDVVARTVVSAVALAVGLGLGGSGAWLARRWGVLAAGVRSVVLRPLLRREVRQVIETMRRPGTPSPVETVVTMGFAREQRAVAASHALMGAGPLLLVGNGLFVGSTGWATVLYLAGTVLLTCSVIGMWAQLRRTERFLDAATPAADV